MDSGSAAALRSVLMRIGVGIAALTAVLLVIACDGGGGDDSPDTTTPGEQNATFDEGTIRMAIEFLDTGLLKGHSYVDAAEGWSVEGVNVTAVLDDGTDWGVIEIPEEGDADFITFFEVQVQELVRGEQVTLTTTAFFTNADGSDVKQAVTDTWPP
jgi:hypothetical protein